MNTAKIKNLQPPRLWVIPVGFAGLILLGTILFKMPFSLNPGKTISWVDALFTATSAVSITGLSTVTICDVFSLTGEVILLSLIQLGGLGIFICSLFMLLIIGKRFSISNEQVVQATFGKIRSVSSLDIVIYACMFTFFFETVGVILISFGLIHDTTHIRMMSGEGIAPIIWSAVFHSVSAYCNAGFSIYPQGCVIWQHSPYLLLVLSGLVIAGGIGFVTIINVRYWYFWRKDSTKRGMLTMQTKIHLVLTLILLLIGTLIFYCFEQDNTLKDMDDKWVQWVNSFFHSANTRTAGLNSVNLAEADPVTLLVFLPLMFIGGCAGSMTGGIKIATFFLIIIAAWTVLRRKNAIQVFDRNVPSRFVAVALMIGLLYIICISVGIFLLFCFEENHPASQTTLGWLAIIFEGVSGFNTVGLSTGITAMLTSGGKMVIILMMFMGRILTMLLAVYLLRPPQKTCIQYPEESVSLG